MSLPWKVTGDEISKISKFVSYDPDDNVLREEEEEEEKDEVETDEQEDMGPEGGEETEEDEGYEHPEGPEDTPAHEAAEMEGEELAEADCHTAMIGCLADKCDFHNAEVNMCTRDDIKVDERGACLFYKSVGMEQADQERAEEQGPEEMTDIAPIETPEEEYTDSVSDFMEPQAGEIRPEDLEEAGCKTPGRKIRSKGKGRGLARGRGAGPIGRPGGPGRGRGR